MKAGIPVLDLFAGPGGLGEGFSRYERADGSRPFRIRLSIEKDPAAHATLTLRSFLRQFPSGEVPPEYSRLLRGQMSVTELFGLSERASAAAFAESWLCELGSTAESEVDARIREQLRGAEYWILIGGPPCQAYSLVGRSRMRSVDPVRFEKDPRHFLYREYLRILGRHRPAVFVMENVKGLLSATHEGACIFERVLTDLAEPGRALGLGGSLRLRYRLHALAPGREPELLDGPPLPEDFVVRSELVGLPQARHRVILLGIREDIEARPRYLRRRAAVALRDVIGDLPPLRSRLSDGSDSIAAWRDALVSCAAELRRIFWRTAIADFLEERISRLNRELSTGSAFLKSAGRPTYRPEWFADGNAEGIWGHVARSHIREDIQRYFFAASFAACAGRSPVLADFPGFLLPNHRNVRRALKGGLFGDRFRVQVADRPATTITSHISKDGHYYIHPDPFQARSLTVREAARIQTFPDNYLFLGSRTAQYHQIGNAVPPLLAREIAAVVDEIGQGRT